MTKLEGMLRAFERRNFAGKNGIYNVRCHQLDCPSFLVGVRAYKCLVRVGKLTLIKI
ncbi:hypothetical protein NEUTE1DRAFT_39160 [Neurospora tetrasperma FGSC 2508]|uniref:Uncharacterized protein n=1 Tax=Neurospora tetrasperma (strain FGSC 2508 / ATCC MYA-4615 / P0657) TaxID=510951 RepID=F8MHA0_NEUT8|nr:uncharacterized protein NEUTE1DRAFT_39160 [Neurospora tetrasperma FGSC 2508]EGO58765.1 hypothetical protein NEUTE1DRAFT_39160 [Neurospora tetrasperma FGSC 2508]EGZ72858.1 hypothetical protein NEUTE2DRAFT_60082 [Neurospora tetrasperma FGSC 2509]